ncbi:MAG: protein O-mannosyl-transferase family [Planctomycetota bacterium]
MTGERIGLQYLLVLAAAGALYVLTCAPTILWQDSGLLVYRIWHNDIEGNLGLALAHPLYVMVGIVIKSIPAGDLAYRINLMSAVFGAVTVANLFLLVRLWLGKTLPALVSAITLAVSWTLWQSAVVAEVYTLYTAHLFGELILLLQYTRTRRKTYLCLLGLLNGLAIANHLWGAISLACYAVFLVVLLARRQIKPRHLGLAVILWVIGAAPYEYLVIKNIIMSGDVAGTLSSAVFGNLWQRSVLNMSVSLKMALENVVFVLLNFPTPNFALLLVGLWALGKKAPNRSFANIAATLLVLYFLFAFRYTVADRHVFFLPFYCIAAILVGLGADIALERCNRKSLAFLVLAFALLPIPSYFMTPELARKAYKPLGQRRQRPYRDEYTYFLQPWKTGYRGAERFASEALDMVEENAVIYAYTTDVHALLYMQEVLGKRPDVRIVSVYDQGQNAPPFNEDTVADLVNNPALYVASRTSSYCPDFLTENYDFIKRGVLWRVVAKKTT